MQPVEEQWWEAVHGRAAGAQNVCSKGYHGHANGWHVVHVTCAEQNPERAGQVLKGHGGIVPSPSAHSLYPTTTTTTTAAASSSSLSPAAAAAATTTTPPAASGAARHHTAPRRFPRLFAEHERPGGGTLQPVVRYPAAVSAPGTRYGPYPHYSPTTTTADYVQQQPPSNTNTSPSPFPGFNACRQQQMTLEHLLQRYPTVRAQELMETGLSVDDIECMYRHGGSNVICLLTQRGLDYQLLRQHGRTRNFLGITRELDVKKLPFGRCDWQWLGVKQPSDIGLKMEQWNQLKD